MRILVLSKRQYLGKDLLDDRFWRYYELPRLLARRGHDVRVLLLSYRRREEGSFSFPEAEGVVWQSINAGFPLPWGISRYFKQLYRTLDSFCPDLVWAGSDAYHAIVAWQYCRFYRVPFVIDLYDNYESFNGTKVPGVRALFRRACRAADGLTVISHMLDDYVDTTYGTHRPRRVLGNAVPKEVFFPREKQEARESLGLPKTGRLIGTAGALTKERGISVLFDAFLRLAADDPDLWLVLAGPRDETLRRYPQERIIDLGILDPDRVPLVLNALDVAVICNLDSDFGRYCFPQKFYEIVACGVPVVAANVGEMKRLLAPWPDLLFPPTSAAVLAERIGRQLGAPLFPHEIQVPAWKDQAIELERFLGQFCS